MIRCTESRDDIDRWFEENPSPTPLQLAQRCLPHDALRYSDDLELLGEALFCVWVEQADGRDITLREAAEILIPILADLPPEEGEKEEDRRARFGGFVQKWLIEKGLPREAAVAILERHHAQQREEAS